MKALQHAKLNLRDADAQLYDSVGIRVLVSTPKAHEERGRVERKIRTIREMLEKTGVQTNVSMTVIQWETTFAKIASTIDDLPLAKGNPSTVSNVGFEILTANRIKLGRNNQRSMEGAGIELDMSGNLVSLLKQNREVYHTWYTLFIENIHMLTMKANKWNKTDKLPAVDDVVLFTMTDGGVGKNEMTWKLGNIVSTEPRKLKISYFSNVNHAETVKLSEVIRNPRNVSVVCSADELFVNTKDHYNGLFKQ